MTATSNALINACGADADSLKDAAQRHLEDWAGWLSPVSGESLTGEDPTYNEQFQQIREEVNKLSGVDTALISSLSEALLTSVSKDLRVLTFYLWSRLHQDGERGLAEGLELLAGMLQHFGDALHPHRARSRLAALTWLGSTRVTDSLSLWPEADLALTRRICGALLLVHDALHEEERPLLSPLLQALEVRLAQNGGADSVVPQNSSGQPVAESAAVHLTPVATGQALMDQAKLLAKYLREQPEGWLAAHHLMKSVRWDTITRLPALYDNGNTRLKPPKPDSLSLLKRLYLQQSWMELLELTDSLFAQGVNHLWFDLQWYAFEAHSRLHSGHPVNSILQQDLRGLLSRVPGLETLCFDDGTPFADEVTRSWIAQSVMSDPAAGMWDSEPSLPVNAHDDDILALESEALERADSDGLDAALSWLQARPGVISAREQWLVRLLMARLCEQCGRSEMALHLLDELNQHGERMTLAQWSPEFMFEVRARRLKLLRGKAARSESDKQRLQPEMDVLLSGLIALDPSRAAVLCS